MGFGLQPRVSPLDDYDQFQMMKRIIERLKSEEELNAYAILKKIKLSPRSWHRLFRG
jgi:hypothetical protein